MGFETVERCGRIHVIVNGVESAGFIERDRNGREWGRWDFVLVAVESADEGLAHIADAMGDWYTVTQAAARLVELGAFDEPPSPQMMGIWCRAGKFPGATKILGRGARGSGGQWRISEAGLVAFIAERREQ